MLFFLFSFCFFAALLALLLAFGVDNVALFAAVPVCPLCAGAGVDGCVCVCVRVHVPGAYIYIWSANQVLNDIEHPIDSRS